VKSMFEEFENGKCNCAGAKSMMREEDQN